MVWAAPEAVREEGHRREVHAGRSWWRRLAAYGGSGGLEESAQGGELEERVERHVIWARAGGTVASVLAGGWWAQGLRPGSRGRVSPVGWCRVRFGAEGRSLPLGGVLTLCNPFSYEANTLQLAQT